MARLFFSNGLNTSKSKFISFKRELVRFPLEIKDIGFVDIPAFRSAPTFAISWTRVTI